MSCLELLSILYIRAIGMVDHELRSTAGRPYITDCYRRSLQVFPLNGAMLNGSSLLLVQNVSGHIELSRSKITWILVQLPISPLLVQLLDGTN